jgi:hypothetical protein
MTRLIEAELHRRAAQDRFFASLRRQGEQCCGRIAGCPLAIVEAA